ncbi:hypothetical protein JJJ17_09755 [Paracoccus caeni]|uniref:Uncharacterized protein n=1 Tax=Paracoccus caeni TaxID=657651 RepID=A0A934SKS0_9RHOB|nr:DUF6478 family protein [Paracoccus caeni]MBK4216208.1 hypothetical protein [Paracoccus caeni]
MPDRQDDRTSFGATEKPGGWLGRKMRESAGRQWANLAQRALRSRRSPDIHLCDEARLLHADLTRFLQRADALQEGRKGQTLPDLPPGTDWKWQLLSMRGGISPAAVIGPQSGRRFGSELALWHDCARHALILRQLPNRTRPVHPAFGLQLEILGFSGSYLSLSLDLPDEILTGLDRRQVLRLDTIMQAERAITVYARLNLVQGPNTETILRQMGHPIDGPNAQRNVEFDLAYADLAEQPVSKVWLDLIFEKPNMNAVTIHDLILSRHPRAAV